MAFPPAKKPAAKAAPPKKGKTGLNAPSKAKQTPRENTRAGAMRKGFSPKGFPQQDGGKPVGSLKGAARPVGSPGVIRPAAGGQLPAAKAQVTKSSAPSKASGPVAGRGVGAKAVPAKAVKKIVPPKKGK